MGNGYPLTQYGLTDVPASTRCPSGGHALMHGPSGCGKESRAGSAACKKEQGGQKILSFVRSRGLTKKRCKADTVVDERLFSKRKRVQTRVSQSEPDVY